MFIVRALASIALIFLPLSATAQLTLAPDDLRPSLGMTWEQEIARLTAISSPATAIAAESWGALKQKFAE